MPPQYPQPLNPNAPRPTTSQVTGARIQIYAQHHPVGFAVRGGVTAGAVTTLLALATAAPSLADPVNVPGWTLVAMGCATLIGGLSSGLLLYLLGRNLPPVAETNAARYASAKLQAASGAPGPDCDTNRLARQLSEHFVHTSNPVYYVIAMVVALAFIALLPLVDVVGPGVDFGNLFQSSTLFPIGVAVTFAFMALKPQPDGFRAYREAYDRSVGD